MAKPTPQQLVDRARFLDDECALTISSKQADWLEDLLYDDEGEPKPPQLTPAAEKFLSAIYEGFYTDPSFEEEAP